MNANQERLDSGLPLEDHDDNVEDTSRKQESPDEAEYDRWFRDQIYRGITDLEAGRLSDATDVFERIERRAWQHIEGRR